MSNFLRQNLNSRSISKPRPPPIPTPLISDSEDHSSSDSSASSAASVATVRPSSREQTAPPSHWTRYFDQELFLEQTTTEEEKRRYHVYLTLPTDVEKGPLFICHHGAGASALSFATFALELRKKLPSAGILSLEARGHGSTITPSNGEELLDYSLDALTSDAVSMIRLTAEKLSWPTFPPAVLVGHSLGGAVVTNIAKSHFQLLQPNFIGYAVLDVVEGSAIEALAHMQTYLSSRPAVFASVDDAIQWHLRSRTLRDPRSAEASVPSLLVVSSTTSFGSSDGDGSGDGKEKLIWRTNLAATAPWWEEWFRGMSGKFLTGRGAKLLILAGADRLDKELMIGQMQGKFQLVVLPEAGHFVHEDAPEKTAGLLVEFFRRNDRSQMVLPPKVGDLLAMGKKV